MFQRQTREKRSPRVRRRRRSTIAAEGDRGSSSGAGDGRSGAGRPRSTYRGGREARGCSPQPNTRVELGVRRRRRRCRRSVSTKRGRVLSASFSRDGPRRASGSRHRPTRTRSSCRRGVSRISWGCENAVFHAGRLFRSTSAASSRLMSLNRSDGDLDHGGRHSEGATRSKLFPRRDHVRIASSYRRNVDPRGRLNGGPPAPRPGRRSLSMPSRA